MSLRNTYTLIAPIYDAFLERATRSARQASLAQIEKLPASTVLISGIGTGLDLPWLPPQHRYVGVDLTPAMLARALPRKGSRELEPVVGDAQRLPFADGSFDHAVLHLILAVVPAPAQCLREAARVLKPGGQILVFDKFLRRGEAAPVRRLLNPVSRRIATRLDVVFEDLLADCDDVALVSDEPAAAGGWFRRIRLRKR